MPDTQLDLSERLAGVQKRLSQAIKNADREDDSVQLLAVSKTKPSTAIREIYQLKQRHFGENYLNEALQKQADLADLDICWHFIGPIQSNKTRALAENFDWVHSVDRLKIARRLSEQRPAELAPLNICLQINLDNEESKAGITLDELDELIKEVKLLPKIKLRGLMAIPAKQSCFAAQKTSLMRLSSALLPYSENDSDFDTLSMGMSADLDAAVAAGSTMVRIGTDIFGARASTTGPADS